MAKNKTSFTTTIDQKYYDWLCKHPEVNRSALVSDYIGVFIKYYNSAHITAEEIGDEYYAEAIKQYFDQKQK